MKNIILIVSVLIVGVLSTPIGAELYRWVDDAGRVHFTDKAPATAKAKKLDLQINSYTTPDGKTFKFDPALISKRKASTEVVMYSTTWCGYCKKARRYFQQQSIPFEEYDVEKTTKGKRDYKSLNGRGVPIILVGNRRMNGFSPEQFDKLYAGR